MSRVRTETEPNVTGTIRYRGIDQSTSTAVGCKSTCVDELLEGDGHDLTITRTVRNGHMQNGSKYHNSYYGTIVCKNHCIYYFRNPESGNFAPLAVPGRPDPSHSATRLLAMTNPSRPVVDIPVLIGEMGDLPRLVQLAGKGIAKKIASGNLSAQFGWAPLIGDVSKLLEFTSHVDKRMKELEALKSKGLRRTRHLWEGNHSTFTGSVFTQSHPALVQTKHDITRKTSLVVRGHVRWYPTGDFPKTDAAMLRLARRAAAGLTLDPSTAWELIPFSWLADWYGNVGTYLKASRNLVPCFHTTPNIMEYTKTETYAHLSWADHYEFQGSNVTVTREQKTRRRVSASLTASLPALSAKQLSILGSLAILKKR